MQALTGQALSIYYWFITHGSVLFQREPCTLWYCRRLNNCCKMYQLWFWTITSSKQLSRWSRYGVVCCSLKNITAATTLSERKHLDTDIIGSVKLIKMRIAFLLCCRYILTQCGMCWLIKFILHLRFTLHFIKWQHFINI